MPEIIITKRRQDGSQAKVVIVCHKPIIRDGSDKEVAEMLLEAEMDGNSSGRVRVHFNNLLG